MPTMRPSSTATTGAPRRASSSESCEGGAAAFKARSALAALAAGEGAGVEPGSVAAAFAEAPVALGVNGVTPAVALEAPVGVGARAPWGMIDVGLSLAPLTGRLPSVRPVSVAITDGG